MLIQWGCLLQHLMQFGGLLNGSNAFAFFIGVATPPRCFKKFRLHRVLSAQAACKIGFDVLNVFEPH